MKITLQEWARRHYSPPPSIRILRAWASTGQIPGAEKVGTSYMVDEDAIRNPMVVKFDDMKMSQRAQQILKAA